MKKKPIWLSIVSAVLLAGCFAPPAMVRSFAPMSQDQKDRTECSYQAISATAAIDNPFILVDMRNEVFVECLRARGFREAGRD